MMNTLDEEHFTMCMSIGKATNVHVSLEPSMLVEVECEFAVALRPSQHFSVM